MANKKKLSELRAGTVINATSSAQEKDVLRVVRHVAEEVARESNLSVSFEPRIHLRDIVKPLRAQYDGVEWHYEGESSSIKPDGGFLFIHRKDGHLCPILITEVKNQGTNDRRAQEGLKSQAKGNAIERLGKNVIGLRTYMAGEDIFPFACFGYGCDFAEGSSIRDRVITIAQFGALNHIGLAREASCPEIKRGSFFFREASWSFDEMAVVCLEIARRSVLYYRYRYGEDFQTLEEANRQAEG